MHKPTDSAPAPAPELASSVLSQLQTESGNPSSSSEPRKAVEPLRMELMEKLWVTMVETFGHRWTSSFGDCPRPDHAWAKHLSGLNGRQIANGLSQLNDLEDKRFPPSATQFRAMCLHVPGLPSEAEAWDQALRADYGHEAVRVAAEATGTFDLRTAKLNDKGLRDRFNRNFAIVRARAVMGKPLDDKIAEGIGHESKSPMQQQLASMHQTARDLITAQGLPTDGKAARAHLLAMLGIKRRDNHA